MTDFESDPRVSKAWPRMIEVPIGVIMMLILMSSVFVGIGLIGYQIFVFLKDGFWVSFSPLDLLKLFEESSLINVLNTWAENPRDWIGFHGVIEFIPLSLFLIIIIPIIFALIYKFIKNNPIQFIITLIVITLAGLPLFLK